MDTFVCGGSWEESISYIDKKGLLNNAIPLSVPSDFVGRGGFKVIFTGTFYKRSNLLAILEQMSHRGAEVVVDQDENHTGEGTARFLYTNHRGETAERNVIPARIHLGDNHYHPDTQWLLDAWDFDRQNLRTFAMRDIKEWK